MAGITQTIASFNQGISEQPDHLKFQGQVRDVVNAIPDVTYGLFKRPGAARVGTAPLASVASGGSWFHYFRDDNEGAYVGQVDSSGVLRIWKASGDNAGAAQTVVYGTGGQTAIQNYLTTSDPENLQFLTINDTTFVTNRDSSNSNTLVSTTFSGTYGQSSTTLTVTFNDHGLLAGNRVNLEFTSGSPAPTDGDYTIESVGNPNTFTVTTASGSASGNVTVKPLTFDRPEPHCAMIELLRTENGRQYGINIYDSTASSSNLTTVKRATKVKITNHSFSEADGTGHCPGIGTEVYSATAASSYTDISNIIHVKNSSGGTLTSGKDN